MKQKFKIDWQLIQGILGFTIIGVFPILFIKTCREERYIEKYGVNTIVEVSHFRKVHKGKYYYPVYPCGYFIVDGKPYPACTDTVMPVRSKFEIRYNPKDPTQFILVKRVVKD